MGVKNRFQMTLVKNQVQSVESINNTALLVNFPLYQSCLLRGGMSGGDIKLHHSQTQTRFGHWDHRKNGRHLC